jgi:hypothetical protein
MITLILTGVFLGAVLGLQFRIFVLVPVFCVALPLVILDGVSRGDELWRLALTSVVLLVLVQIGYALGSISRSLLVEERAGSRGSVSMPTSARVSRSN